MVEPDTASVEIDRVRNVMPYPSGERYVPVRLAIHVPPQRLIQRSLLAVDDSELQLREVALEEADLVLLVPGRRVRGRVLHAEVVEDLALVDRCRGLRDQLRAEHVVAVPDGTVVDGDLDALRTAAVCRVLVAGGEVDVVGHRTRPVDVVSIHRAISADCRKSEKCSAYWYCPTVLENDQSSRKALEVSLFKRPSQSIAAVAEPIKASMVVEENILNEWTRKINLAGRNGRRYTVLSSLYCCCRDVHPRGQAAAMPSVLYSFLRSKRTGFRSGHSCRNAGRGG